MVTIHSSMVALNIKGRKELEAAASSVLPQLATYGWKRQDG